MVKKKKRKERSLLQRVLLDSYGELDTEGPCSLPLSRNGETSLSTLSSALRKDKEKVEKMSRLPSTYYLSTQSESKGEQRKTRDRGEEREMECMYECTYTRFIIPRCPGSISRVMLI